MINEEKLKKFLSRWVKIPDEMGNLQMNNELSECFGSRTEERTDFTELIGDFITENHRVQGGGTEAEIIEDDHKGSYKKAITKLHSDLRKHFFEIEKEVEKARIIKRGD